MSGTAGRRACRQRGTETYLHRARAPRASQLSAAAAAVHFGVKRRPTTETRTALRDACGASERGDAHRRDDANERAPCRGLHGIGGDDSARGAEAVTRAGRWPAPRQARQPARQHRPGGSEGTVVRSAPRRRRRPPASRKSARFRYASRIWSFDHARSSARAGAPGTTSGERRGTPARSQARIDQRRHLHGDRARAARRSAVQGLDERRRQRTRVHAGVLGEAAILDGDDRGAQRRRDRAQRDPVGMASRGVDAAGVEHDAVAIEEPRVRGSVRSAHGLEGWSGGTCRPQPEHGGERHAAAGERRLPSRHRTSKGAFGVSPNSARAPRAATRVGGSSKVPGWFSRMAYVTTKRPLGT